MSIAVNRGRGIWCTLNGSKVAIYHFLTYYFAFLETSLKCVDKQLEAQSCYRRGLTRLRTKPWILSQDSQPLLVHCQYDVRILGLDICIHGDKIYYPRPSSSSVVTRNESLRSEKSRMMNLPSLCSPKQGLVGFPLLVYILPLRNIQVT